MYWYLDLPVNKLWYLLEEGSIYWLVLAGWPCFSIAYSKHTYSLWIYETWPSGEMSQKPCDHQSIKQRCFMNQTSPVVWDDPEVILGDLIHHTGPEAMCPM